MFYVVWTMLFSACVVLLTTETVAHMWQDIVVVQRCVYTAVGFVDRSMRPQTDVLPGGSRGATR
jgi:hypothetical protein